MYHLKKTVASVICAIMLTVGAVSTYAYSDIIVKVDSLTGHSPQIVNFTDGDPIQVNSVTLAPVRNLADAAGMSVEWNQEQQIAVVTLNADGNSDKPIEVYASEVINKVSGYGLELTPKSITVSLKLDENNAMLKYNFADSEGDIVSIGTSSDLLGSAMLAEDNSLLVPVRGVMELFGLDVVWEQDDMSLKVSIPDYENIVIPNGLGIVPSGLGTVSPSSAAVVSQTVSEDAPVNNDPALGEYLGRFKITHYAPGAEDNGVWGNATAWAGDIIPGQTIGVDPNVIPKLSWVYIEGYGMRRAEDCGAAGKGNIIDVAVSSVSEAYQLGVVYRDVYMVR